MAPLDLVFIALSFFAALLGSWALLAPFFDAKKPETAGLHEESEAIRQLLIRKEAALSSLADLEEDFRSEKISDVEYNPARSDLMREAMRIEAELEKF